jgi:hypothetical protein
MNIVYKGKIVRPVTMELTESDKIMIMRRISELEDILKGPVLNGNIRKLMQHSLQVNKDILAQVC